MKTKKYKLIIFCWLLTLHLEYRGCIHTYICKSNAFKRTWHKSWHKVNNVHWTLHENAHVYVCNIYFLWYAYRAQGNLQLFIAPLKYYHCISDKNSDHLYRSFIKCLCSKRRSQFLYNREIPKQSTGK